MIDWDKSAELNKCTIQELKARFRRYPKSNKKVVAICEECGEERVIRFDKVGELCKPCLIRLNKIDMIGKTFGRWTVISDEGIGKDRSYQYLCRCVCGNEKIVSGHTLRRGDSQSCGCLQIDHITELGKANAGERHYLYGKHIPEATRLKQSAAHIGQVRSAEYCKNISDAKLGAKNPAFGKKRPHSDEARKHISAGHQGVTYDEWCEFARDKKYCPKFDEACRESNREKYGRRCFICNKTEKANGQKLSVHHVDMDKAQGCESNWKLVPLCKHHHATAHNDEIIARLGYMVKDSKTRGKRGDKHREEGGVGNQPA